MEIVSIRVLCSISYQDQWNHFVREFPESFLVSLPIFSFREVFCSSPFLPQVKCAEIKILFVAEVLFHLFSAALERYGREKLLTNCSQMHAPQVFIHQSSQLLMKKATGVYKIPDSSVKVKTNFQPSPQGFQFNMQVIYFRRFWICRRPILVFLEVLGKNFRPNLTRTQHL